MNCYICGKPIDIEIDLYKIIYSKGREYHVCQNCFENPFEKKRKQTRGRFKPKYLE